METNSCNNLNASNTIGVSRADMALITRLQRRDKIAFEILYDKYASALYGAILALVGDEPLAQNILEASFQEYWARIIQINPRTEKIFTWMLKIARSKCNLSVRPTNAGEQRYYMKKVQSPALQ